MDFLTDWKFWAFLIGLVGLTINWLASYKIATNHLSHIDNKLDKIEGKVDAGFNDIKHKIAEHDVDIAVLKTKQKIK